MDCACHGEPCYWQKDKRRSAGGHWRCAVKKRERNSRSHATFKEQRNEKQRARWHSTGGGYVQRRLAQLAAQRQQVTEQLAELTREKGTLSD